VENEGEGADVLHADAQQFESKKTQDRTVVYYV
jgi:hypothetical protein